MHIKSFDNWNLHKKNLDVRENLFLFHEGEIWWSAVGVNIGDESCGKGETFRRPVLILKKLSQKSFIGIPLSTKRKAGSWFTEIRIHNEIQTVLLYQIRMFSTRRFQRRLTTLDYADFLHIKNKLENLLKLTS